MLGMKEAIRRAKQEITEIFADEEISELGLEEVRFDESLGVWKITLGFTRPWRNPKSAFSGLSPSLAQRDFKVVTLDGTDGRLVAIEERRLMEHG